MGIDVMAVFHTKTKIDSKTTNFLADILIELLPKSYEWMSSPDEDDPLGERWNPEWHSVSEAIAEIERFLRSPESGKTFRSDVTAEEIRDELKLFLEELRAASAHTDRFYLTVF